MRFLQHTVQPAANDHAHQQKNPPHARENNEQVFQVDFFFLILFLFHESFFLSFSDPISESAYPPYTDSSRTTRHAFSHVRACTVSGLHHLVRYGMQTEICGGLAVRLCPSEETIWTKPPLTSFFH